MARPSVISLELPTQGFSFQDVESSIIMFPFRRDGKEKGGGGVREPDGEVLREKRGSKENEAERRESGGRAERERRGEGGQTLMVAE